jgi:hypothetical protein
MGTDKGPAAKAWDMSMVRNRVKTRQLRMGFLLDGESFKDFS